MKDKLFFFVNPEITRREDPAFSANLGAGKGNNLFLLDGTPNAAKSPCTPSATLTQAQCDAAWAM